MSGKQSSTATNNSQTGSKEASTNQLASSHTNYHRRCCESTTATTGPAKRSPAPPPIRPKAPPKSEIKPTPTPSQKLQSTATTDPSSQQEIVCLSDRFEKLSSSILNLATSRASLDVRSLEILLTKHISDSLGTAVNDPNCCKDFIHATRDILEKLTGLCEEGKINRHLIQNQDPSKRFIHAKSTTTVCYRDRYLKELVMNSLQSMCSDSVEEEVFKKPQRSRSPASQERVRAIKEKVRAELGITPEPFLELERQLAELKRKMSENALKVMKETKKVEEAISRQIERSDDYVRIPTPVRKVLGGEKWNVKQSNDDSESSESGVVDSSSEKSSCKLKKKNFSNKKKDQLGTANAKCSRSITVKSEGCAPKKTGVVNKKTLLNNLDSSKEKPDPNNDKDKDADVINDTKETSTKMSSNCKRNDFLGNSQDHSSGVGLGFCSKDNTSECLKTTSSLKYASLKQSNKLNPNHILDHSTDNEGTFCQSNCNDLGLLLNTLESIVGQCSDFHLGISSENTNPPFNNPEHIQSKLNKGKCRLQDGMFKDSVEFVKPLINRIVQEEINKVKEKGRRILNEIAFIEKEKNLEQSFQRYSEILDHKVLTDDDDDDEITVEETKLFLEALKADIANRIRDPENVINVINCDLVLENIGEDEKSSLLDANEEVLESQVGRNVTETDPNTVSSLKEKCLDSDTENLIQNSAKQDNMKMSFDFEMVSSTDKTLENEALLQRIKSKWWFPDNSVLNELMKEMKQEFERLNIKSDDKPEGIQLIDKKKADDLENIEVSEKLREFEDDITIEEMANIISNVSAKISQLPLYIHEKEPRLIHKEEMLKILRILHNCLEDTVQFEANVFAIEDPKQFIITTKNISETFSFLAEKLSRTPSGLKNQPFSIMNPPESLNKTLAALASTAYFRGSFIRGIVQSASSKKMFHKCLTNISSWPDAANVSKNDSSVVASKELEIVKPYDSLAEQKSSGDIEPMLPVEENANEVGHVVQRFRDVKKPNDIQENLFNFEHYLGYTASVMTVQNVSDMFLFLSSVLNDIPSRIKSERIMNLQPPSTLLKALEILYYADDGPFPVMEKNVSFASLTVQNASDMFLTLSKTFQNTPPRVRNSTVLDLGPPQSLLLALHMLTSLSYNSVLESRSQEEVQDEGPIISRPDSREDFYDAVDSLTSLT